jgi:hypothetical protein
MAHCGYTTRYRSYFDNYRAVRVLRVVLQYFPDLKIVGAYKASSCFKNLKDGMPDFGEVLIQHLLHHVTHRISKTAFRTWILKRANPHSTIAPVTCPNTVHCRHSPFPSERAFLYRLPRCPDRFLQSVRRNGMSSSGIPRVPTAGGSSLRSST